MQSFYQRELPSIHIPFSSDDGISLFTETLPNGTLRNYFPLAEQYVTQSEPAYCALASLVMVLNAFHIDPQRVWKAPWRWFDQTMLECCTPLDWVAQHGMTLPQFACLASCYGLDVSIMYGDDPSCTLERFKSDLIRCSTQPGAFMVASYSRKTMQQTGDGHYTPIVGLSASDRTLVLDTARFKYGAHWTPVEVMWEALKPMDSSTGRSRGYCVLTYRKAPFPPVVPKSECGCECECLDRDACSELLRLRDELVNAPASLLAFAQWLKQRGTHVHWQKLVMPQHVALVLKKVVVGEELWQQIDAEEQRAEGLVYVYMCGPLAHREVDVVQDESVDADVRQWVSNERQRWMALEALQMSVSSTQ
jgi:glutathione gamma-glutamylcysteinyltransferase